MTKLLQQLLAVTLLLCSSCCLAQIQNLVTTAGCGSVYSCMRYPDGCESPNCQSIVRWKTSNTPGAVDVWLMAQTKGWVALGISYDSSMGNDSVMHCVSNSSNPGSVDVGFSYNWFNSTSQYRGNTPLQSSEVTRPLQNASYSAKDSEIHCTFTRVVRSDGDKIFSLNEPYYLFLGFGDADAGVKKMHAVMPRVSPNKIDMTQASLSNIGGPTGGTPGGSTGGNGTTEGLLTDNSGNTVKYGVTQDGKNVHFTLTRTLSTPAASEWVALGFSKDQNMEDDSVVECVRLNDGTMVVRNSYNYRFYNTLSNPQNMGILSPTTSINNGVMQCDFLRPISGVGQHDVFDLTQPYYPLMAWGTVADKGVKNKHTDKKAFDRMVDFSKDTTSLNSTSGGGPCIVCLKRSHGILMITAWVLIVSTSIIIARYYKNCFGDKKICAADVWFSLHRFLMLLALACTIAAFIIIFYVNKGKLSSYAPGSPSYFWVHAPLGIVVMILVILNPLMAAFRCHPNTKYRPIYNWLHWFVGTCAHVIALITIFFGIKIGELGPEKICHMAVFWIMIAFVGFHVLIEIILSIDKCIQEARSGQTFQVQYEMSKPGEVPRVVEPTAGGCSVVFRHIVLIFYFLVVLGLWLGMIILIGSGKIN